MFHPIGTPSGDGRVRSRIATHRPRLSALAFSVTAFASGYSYAGTDLILDNLIIKGAYAPSPSATGAGSIALGAGAQAKGEDLGDYSAIAIGTQAIADGRATIAIGEGANVHGDRSSALGVGSKVNADRALALGADASVTAHDAVALGQGSVADRGNAVSIGKSGNERQLVNLRAGTTDTDAVNLSQLKPVVEALGGEATINADGSVRGPNYKIDGRSFGDVGSALTNLDERAKTNSLSITTLDGRVTNVEGDVKSLRVDVDDLGARLNDGVTGLVRQDPSSLAISIGEDKGGTSVSVAGTDGTRVLTGLRAGTKDADAVNLSQLKPVVEALGGEATINADGSVRGPNYKIDGRSFGDVGSALTNLDERAKTNSLSITTLDGRVTNVEGDVKSLRVDVDDLGTRLNDGITGLVRQDPASLAISIGADKGGASVSVAGKDGTRVLTGLSNGVDDTDAVTIAQLKATGLIDPNGKQLGALVYDDLTLGRATLGGVGGTLLANVAPGMIAAGSMEAVNGGQLFTMQQKIDLLDTRLTNFENDKPASPPPPPGGNHGNDFAQFGDGSGATGKNSIAIGQNAKASGDESVALGTNSTASGKNSVALGNNSVADRDDTVSVGAPGHERQITNVKAGTAPTDAVNVQQLRDQIGSVRNDIDHYRRDASGGIASAVAIANLPQASLAGESMVSIAGGTYSGQSAVAFGLSTATRNGRWVVKASGSTNTRGTVAIGAGAGYRW